MSDRLWFLRRLGPPRVIRLYCFCFAGGNSVTFLPWQTLAHPSIEICAVQLPGRGMRLHEQPYNSMPPLIDELATVVMRDANLPFAFFGHSLGGLLAFELARRLSALGRRTPQHLLISGCLSPGHVTKRTRLHEMPDDELLMELGKYRGTPGEVLSNRELMTLVLPTLRADLSLAENYRHTPATPLDLPITVLAGKDDQRDSDQQVHGWHEETTRAFQARWFDGGHFFIHSQLHAVIDCINETLSSHIDVTPNLSTTKL